MADLAFHNGSLVHYGDALHRVIGRSADGTYNLAPGDGRTADNETVYDTEAPFVWDVPEADLSPVSDADRTSGPAGALGDGASVSESFAIERS